jgi:hypothetical protein
MFRKYTLNRYTNKCICCDNTSKVNIEIGYNDLPFKYVKCIETYIFYVKVWYYCHYHCKYDSKIYNKIIKNTCDLLDIFLK